MTVALVTASVNWVQAFGGFSASNEFNYLVTWLGYAVSLFLIGKSLALTLYEPTNASSAFVPGYLLLLVGLGGAITLLLPKSLAFVPIIGTSALYIVFFVLVALESVHEARVGALVYFALVTTVFYILPFILGFPTNRDTSGIATEQWLYFVGNLLTKIGLPAWELWTLEPRGKKPSTARPFVNVDTSLPTIVTPTLKFHS